MGSTGPQGPTLTNDPLRIEGEPVWDATYSYEYDADGRATNRNLGEGNEMTLDWDSEGRLTSIPGAPTVTLACDFSGQRIRVLLAERERRNVVTAQPSVEGLRAAK
jgi:YD repeat-containing protein